MSLPDAREDLLAVLRLLAERAGRIVLAHYVEGGQEVGRRKADASPVTAADEESEAFLEEALAKLAPEIPVIAEEAAAAGKLPQVEPRGRFWLVDPLDGTKEFLSGTGEFTVNIALIENGQAVAGVVHAPALAMTWAGTRQLATFSETDRPAVPIAARAIPVDGVTVVASRRHTSGAELEKFLADWKVETRVTAGSSLKFCLVASGKADLYPRFGRTMEWDTAAGQAVLEAAGGSVETLQGGRLSYGKPGFENPAFIAFGRRS